jgi:DNA topoisomerase-1
MPKPDKRTNEEKAIEGFIPEVRNIKKTTEKFIQNIVPEIPKKTIEKLYSQEKPKLEKIEKVSKDKNFSKNNQPKPKKQKFTTTKGAPFKPQQIDLKERGYELIITEKPQAAAKIANALGHATQRQNGKISYYEVDRDNKKIIVACAVGHLFTLKQNSQGSVVPTFDISWVPNYLARKGDFTKNYYETILKLCKQAGSLTVATDYDVEGEVIGMNVIRYICGQKDANRMKFSTLTKPELEKAYENKSSTLSWGQGIAGETRHYLDWFYGINVSRALMNAIKTTGKFKIMSSGRVQGPALKLIVDKEKEIQKFTPVPYWQIFIDVQDPKTKNAVQLCHVKDIFDKKELEKFKNLKGKKANALTTKQEKNLPPNPPFNLTTLQTEAYKFHGINPAATLRAAQSLYLAGLISYPRTSSQKLPDSIDYNSILRELIKKTPKYEKFIKRGKPIEGEKTDPAHPSIYPTGNHQILSGDEEKVYNLIMKRFLSLFCEDAIIDTKKITAEVDNLKFTTNGIQIRKKAWMEIYPSTTKENEIPDMNGIVDIIDSKIEQKETQPPKRFSQASLVSELEKRNLGTKATRASILETLFDRGYVKGDRAIEATPLGISLIETLEKYSPVIVDEELTRNFEKEMEDIQDSKKSELQQKENIIIEKAKKTITLIAKDFEKNEKNIGKELVQATQESRNQQKIENTLMQCPVCKKGNLAITYSRKTKRNFIACDAYPNCKTTYSLPPSTIKKTDKICEKCNFPMLMSLKKGKKPWFFCFNKNCPSNQERLEEYRKKQEEKGFTQN